MTVGNCWVDPSQHKPIFEPRWICQVCMCVALCRMRAHASVQICVSCLAQIHSFLLAAAGSSAPIKVNQVETVLCPLIIPHPCAAVIDRRPQTAAGKRRIRTKAPNQMPISGMPVSSNLFLHAGLQAPWPLSCQSLAQSGSIYFRPGEWSIKVYRAIRVCQRFRRPFQVNYMARSRTMVSDIIVIKAFFSIQLATARQGSRIRGTETVCNWLPVSTGSFFVPQYLRK